CARGAMDYW
nr:immunoglobulin heavy chain junction region [Mus musculus]